MVGIMCWRWDSVVLVDCGDCVVEHPDAFFDLLGAAARVACDGGQQFALGFSFCF
jgi:hypothetical protein